LFELLRKLSKMTCPKITLVLLFFEGFHKAGMDGSRKKSIKHEKINISGTKRARGLFFYVNC